jgi:hypothetical protein
MKGHALMRFSSLNNRAGIGFSPDRYSENEFLVSSGGARYFEQRFRDLVSPSRDCWVSKVQAHGLIFPMSGLGVREKVVGKLVVEESWKSWIVAVSLFRRVKKYTFSLLPPNLMEGKDRYMVGFGHQMAPDNVFKSLSYPALK